ISRQAAGGSIDRKLPSRPVVTCQEVVPVRPLTMTVTTSSGRKPTPHIRVPTAIGGSAIGCVHSRTRAWPVWGTIGWGGIGPGQPIGFAVMGLAVIGGQGFGLSHGSARGWPWVGAASGCGVARLPGVAVAATADPFGLEVAREPRPAWDDDVHAAVNSPIRTIALRVAFLVMVIGL